MERTNKHFRKRDAILNCVRSTDAHPSADWVFEHVKEQVPDISLATVYRNLALFKDQGLITSLGTVKGVERFDGNTDPHVHFICHGCGGVNDLHQLEVPTALARTAADLSQAEVEGCQLTFTGLCRNCKNEKLEEAI